MQAKRSTLERRAARAMEEAREIVAQARELAALNQQLQKRVARANRELHRHMSDGKVND